MSRHVVFSLTALLVAATGIAQGAAVITIGAGVGSVRLGVNNLGHLNTAPVGVAGTVNGTSGFYGLAVNLADPGRAPGFYDSTSPGCLCEGWGVAGNGVAGFANVAAGSGNLTLDSFSSTASTAVSEVHLTSLPGLSVTHDYHAAAGSPLNTFEALVSIENTTAATINNVLYRRVMDWDIPYTEFSEAVTIQGWPATALLRTTDNGFDTANPLAGGVAGIACPVNANFTDCAPGVDHGALFDFTFGNLAAGETKTFKIFYGAALSETAALAALGAVGAEVYSLGQSDASGGSPTLGTPATYFFGFAGVGGTPVAPIPEPASFLLLIPMVAYGLKRKFQKA